LSFNNLHPQGPGGPAPAGGNGSCVDLGDVLTAEGGNVISSRAIIRLAVVSTLGLGALTIGAVPAYAQG